MRPGIAERLADVLGVTYMDDATEARDRAAMYLATDRPHLASLYQDDARAFRMAAGVAWTIARAARSEREFEAGVR